MKSPIFSFFGETLNGVSTIRAFCRTKEFSRKFEFLIDQHQQAFFPTIVSNRKVLKLDPEILS
jgi:hypothetical protein